MSLELAVTGAGVSLKMKQPFEGLLFHHGCNLTDTIYLLHYLRSQKLDPCDSYIVIDSVLRIDTSGGGVNFGALFH